jgi:class 3 adenylate cyclase/pimeloyl-ACP methyl ester carboxylesterase
VEVPRIQYATTSDGINIAFATAGEGLPLIVVPPVPWSDVQAEWADPRHRSFYAPFAQRLQHIRYDTRGSGSSDRDVPIEVMDDYMGLFGRDIDAVANKLALDRFALLGINIGGPIAIKYAATHPKRVSHLVLWCSPSRTQDVGTPQGEAMRTLRATDYHLFTETAAHSMVAGWESSEEARAYAAFMRNATPPDSPFLKISLESDFDLTEDLGKIKCPTLVLHRRNASFPGVEAARYIAARVPNSELVILEGEALTPWVGDMDSVINAALSFLGVGLPETPAPPEPSSGLVTILFTDIEGSTTLTQQVGDAQAQETVRAHNTIVREALAGHSGKEIKHTGDGIMASFPLASAALEAAIAIEQAVQDQGAFRVRVGLNAGEPLAEDEDLFGSAVQLARRVCDAAPAGSIYVTDVVRQLLAGKGFLFSDRGEQTLRGFGDPVRLYEASWRESQ